MAKFSMCIPPQQENKVFCGPIEVSTYGMSATRKSFDENLMVNCTNGECQYRLAQKDIYTGRQERLKVSKRKIGIDCGCVVIMNVDKFS
jgi:coenzyme F420-reducing hydrogenase delta subunit